MKKTIRKSKEEMAVVKQMILDLCTDYMKASEISKALNVTTQLANRYCSDLCRNVNYLDKISVKMPSGMMAYAYKTIISTYRFRAHAVNGSDDEKLNFIHVPLFGHLPVEHETHGRIIHSEELHKKIKSMPKTKQKSKSSKVYVSGSTLNIIT